MNSRILSTAMAAITLSYPAAFAEDAKTGASSNSSTSVHFNNGTATVTVDVDGMKETRTFKPESGTNTFIFGATEAETPAANRGGITPERRLKKGPWLGIAMQEVEEVTRAQLSLAKSEGVVISYVAPDSPAAKAGLQPNDILLRFEDQIVVEPSQLKKLIAMKKPGDEVKLAYLRKGTRQESNVKLIEHELDSGENPFRRWPAMADPSKLIPPQALQDWMPRDERLKQLKEKHPGIVTDRQSWLSEDPKMMLREQSERLQRSLENSGLPKQEIERIRQDFERVRREMHEAMERAKRDGRREGKVGHGEKDEAAGALKEPREGKENPKSAQPQNLN